MMLDSLAISNFRLFDALKMERLGRFNLITGLNNAGKSCLLEALYLYGSSDLFKSLHYLDGLRHDVDWSGLDPNLPAEHPFRAYFPNYRFPQEKQDAMVIGPIEGESVLKLSVVPGADHPDDLKLHYHRKGKAVGSLSLLQDLRRYAGPNNAARTPPGQMVQQSQLVPTRPMAIWQNAYLWDFVNTRRDMREWLFSSLRLIEPRLAEVVMTGQGRRMSPTVLYEDGRSIPLSALGDGMNHIFQILLSLVSANGNLLLVDELENGIHYQVQADVWRVLFEMAERLDVQLFATTHSWDCIEAFTRVALDTNGDAWLHRLGRSRRTSKQGQIMVTSYDREALQNVEKHQLDVR